MFRTILLVIALLILAGIVLVATGVIHLNQEANGALTVATNPPTIKTETRQINTPAITVGTEARNIQVPVVSVENRQIGYAQ